MNFRYETLKHLTKRGLHDIRKYDARVSDSEFCTTFMLYGVADFLINRTNIKPLGYQTYRQDVTTKKTNNPKNSRYFTYQPKCSVINDVVVFGLERLFVTPDYLFITEGIFEAVNLHRLGHSAIAVLTSDPNKRLRELLPYLAKKTIWCGDNDKAGNNSWLSKACDYRLVFDTDLDETPDDEILSKISLLLTWDGL